MSAYGSDKEAVAKINELVNEAEVALAQAAAIASEFGLEFSFDGPAGSYGMGGWYSSNEWQASSHNC